jgi:HPt (histidine-containing phosphotransfer) domain-containing protein
VGNPEAKLKHFLNFPSIRKYSESTEQKKNVGMIGIPLKGHLKVLQIDAVNPHMNNYQITIPEKLPGINVAFGLKQCVGKTDILQGLLHRFWTDYRNSWQKLGDLNGSAEQQNWLLHDVKGTAENLGLHELTGICCELKEDLSSSNRLSDEPIERLHMELEKVGGSIKKLDSFFES